MCMNMRRWQFSAGMYYVAEHLSKEVDLADDLDPEWFISQIHL